MGLSSPGTLGPGRADPVRLSFFQRHRESAGDLGGARANTPGHCREMVVDRARSVLR